MRSIATPWRLQYILSQREDARCIFCFAPGADDDARLVVHRGQHCFVILNLYPYTSGHLMVIPTRHVSRLGELTDSERGEMAQLLQTSEAILRAEYPGSHFCAGINLDRAAGAGVLGHLHTHLVPLGQLRATEQLAETVEETFARVRRSWPRAN